MLDAYLAQTRRLLQNPSAPTSLYSDEDLTDWINISRGQLAGEAECIRAIGTIPTVVDQQAYNFSAITIPSAVANGVDGVINIRRISYNVGSGQRWITPRSWEWFDYYVLNNPVPAGAEPRSWSQYAQGAAPGNTGSQLGGSFYINLPDAVYTLNCDCVCYPAALADDADPEPIPFLWTDAIPFFAAYYALMSAQNNARMDDAMQYFNMYTQFVERARKFSNPAVNRWMYQQAGDPAQAAKMQIQPRQPNGGA